MVSNHTYKQSLVSLERDRWKKLNLAERVSALQSIENEMASRQGRKACNVKLVAMHTSNYSTELGKYNRETNEIYINQNAMINNSKYGNEPDIHLETILHEGRHAYQVQAVKGIVAHYNPAELDKWKDNLKEGSYIRFRENPRAYYSQPVEKDAREFAQSMQKEITVEQKNAIRDHNQKMAEKNIRDLLSEDKNRIQDYDAARETTRSMLSGQTINDERVVNSKNNDIEQKKYR